MQKSEKKPVDLAIRTKKFALRVIRLYSALPTTAPAQVIGRQILRSGTSVGAQYREAKRARSTAEFLSKLECSLQELDETCYWLDLLNEGKIVPENLLSELTMEATELMAIFIASVNTTKRSKLRS